MNDHGEHAGLRGVGFLFAMILLFLVVVYLQSTGHAKLAVDVGLAGCAVLAASAGLFLWGKWREAADGAAFDDDGDVQFSGAVFLVTAIALAGGLARAAGVGVTGKGPLVLLVVCAITIFARRFVGSLRRPR